MGSHNGLKYVLETKKGYLKKDGSYTSRQEDALLIDFWQFGFGPNPIDVYHRLGFSDSDISCDDVRFKTLIPSYEAIDSIGSYYYEQMGYDLKEALLKARRDYYTFSMHDDENYLKYISRISDELFRYRLNNAKSTFKLNDVDIYELDEDSVSIEGGELKQYCTVDKDIYRYTIELKNPHVENFFEMNKEEINYYNHFQQDGLIDYFKKIFEANKFKWGLKFDASLLDIKIENDKLVLYMDDFTRINGDLLARSINEVVMNFYSKKEMHITRMFGSYILLVRENGILTAKYATNIPIKYCPLMIKLLKEVGGETANELIKTLNTEDRCLQRKMMCNLINEVVIKNGYFDTSRPLNSCEANVTFGASETLYSAFKSNLIDAAVIVSNNLGTIITTNAENTQGSVKRMTGLFYTSPDEKIMATAKDSNIIPVFPYSASIDQLAGVKKAIELGYKNIAVSVAANNNYIHEYLKELEKNYNVKIYKFGLCSTSINEATALVMRDNADVVWSCASKNVKTYIEPNSLIQVGLKIPVHILTSDGWEIVKNHLKCLDDELDLEDITLNKGEDRTIILNSKDHLKVLKKKDVNNCSDCPYPCV